MVISVIDQLFLVVYGTEDPSDDEWRGYLDLMKRHGIERTRQLICTEGGAPSATQRRDLNDLLNGRALPVAVMSSSSRVRGMVAALSWFNRKIRSFPPEGLRDALEHLEVPTSRTDLIDREIRGLRRSLGLDERGERDASTTLQRASASTRLGCLLLAITLVVIGSAAWARMRLAEDDARPTGPPRNIGRPRTVP
jgi:hypothetical protein